MDVNESEDNNQSAASVDATPVPAASPSSSSVVAEGAEGDTRIITKDELKAHRQGDDDIWLAIDGVVYDVKTFADKHPGGEDVLIGEQGTDASEAFHLVGHSKQAAQMMVKYKIGILEKTNKSQSKNEDEENSTSQKSTNCVIL